MPVDPQRLATEVATLRQYAVRYALLAAWRDDLLARGLAVPPNLPQSLETTRVKIASGCASSCDVGCALGEIEATLVTADSSTQKGKVDFWLDLLGQVMGGDASLERLLNLPVVQFHYAGCGLGACGCKH
jgi:hypothetical protein